MQATIRPISPIRPVPEAAGDHVRIDAERILVDGLVVHDRALAGFLAERPAADRAELVERAIRIGLLALQDAGVTVNVDVVRTEFEKLMRQAETVNEKAAQTLEQTLRANFADGDGRLPRTLERFLGDRGALRTMVDELFDESKRDSAIGRIGAHARALLRWRRLQARHPPRSDPAPLPDAPVPPGDDRRLPIARGAPGRHRGGRRRARRRACPVDRQGRRLRGPARGDAGRSRSRCRRPARPNGHRHGLGHEVEEGRLRADPRRAGGARLRRQGRDRGQGPADVDARHPRGAAGRQGEPRRGGRGRGVQPGPCAVGHRALPSRR